jgi:hypothetical protein
MSIDAPIRIVVLVGVLCVAAAAAFAFMVLGRSKAETPAATAPTHMLRHTRATPKTNRPAPRHASGPKLAAGLPAPIAYVLARHTAVVVAVYGHAKGDTESVAEARAGAALAHTPFLALDVTKQKFAEQMASFGGTVSEPTVFVVKRPGTIVRMLQGLQDREVVAQAASHVG